MGSMFPALDIKPVESPLQQYGQVMQIKSGMQQQQLTQLQIQHQQQEIADQAAATKAMASWDGKDYGALPGLVKNAGGSANAVFGMTKNIFAIKQQASEVAKNDSITGQNNVDAAVKQHDEYRGRILNISDGITDPAAKQTAWAAEIAKEQAAGTQLPPGVTSQYPGDVPARAMANSFALGSTLVKEADDKQKLAIDAWKPSGGMLVNAITGEKIGGIPDVRPVNAGLQARWQVLNPGQPLPDYFTLKPNASPADFDRIDKILQQTEASKATKAQQETVNAIRAQTFEMQRDKSDMKPVVGTDPKTGNTVLVPAGQAQQMGIQNPMQAEADTVNKALAGRHWLSLATKPAPPGSTDPSDMSITQLIDKLDKSGKLGAVASRWNEFMTGTVGAGDPVVSALRAKMGLSTTLLMQAHVGNRGSAQMLEHFEDLANQKKLDGPTLKAAFNSEVSYVRDRAMDPNPPDYSQGAGKAANSQPARQPAGNAKTLSASQIQQAARDHGVSVQEATRQAKAAGFTVQ